MPVITVNNESTGFNFDPTPYPRTGTVPKGSSISFQANVKSIITFYAYQMSGDEVVWAFGTAACSAAASDEANPAYYTLRTEITGEVTLSLTNPIGGPGAGGGAGTNGKINVGTGTGGDGDGDGDSQ